MSPTGNGDVRGPSTSGDPECYVLCVDDDAEFVKSLELFLPDRVREAAPSGPQYRFLFFTDPQDALNALAEILSDRGVLSMVISDQQMPQMKGTAFLARIREKSPESIRVLLTGHAGLDSAITAINDRLLDKYLTKPVENQHDFTVSVVHLLQRFWMQRTIDSQRRVIGDLYRFSDALNSLTTLPVTLDQVAEFARDTFGCDHASVWLIEGAEIVSHGEGSAVTMNARVRIQGTDVERLCDPRIVRVTSLQDAPALAGISQSARGALPEPPFLRATLVYGSQVLGVLVVGDRTNGLPFDERDEEILAYIADTASIAIYNRLQSAELASAYQESSHQAIELAGANERLRMLDGLKNDFLNFVSHELRTPLTVLSAVEFLDAGGRPDQTEIVKVVRSGYERLKRFIETALAYRTWIVGDPARPDTLVSVAELVSDAVRRVPGLAGPRADMEVILAEEPCLVRGSASDLGEVIRILLDNSVRFSSDLVHVRLRCEASRDEVRLSVEDRGVGFAPELSEEILKPFTIADSLHHQSGSALSLAKANAIVIAHGGGIQAESEGQGKGAKFTVRLPRARSLDAHEENPEQDDRDPRPLMHRQPLPEKSPRK